MFYFDSDFLAVSFLVQETIKVALVQVMAWH